MTELKPCPFCGSPVHWDDDVGIIHDEIRFNCIVDMVWPLESNMNISKEMWIKKWNKRVEEYYKPEPKTEPALKPCPFCGGQAHVYETVNGGTRKLYWVECLNCYAESPKSLDSPQDSIDAWNKRVEE